MTTKLTVVLTMLCLLCPFSSVRAEEHLFELLPDNASRVMLLENLAELRSADAAEKLHDSKVLEFRKRFGVDFGELARMSDSILWTVVGDGSDSGAELIAAKVASEEDARELMATLRGPAAPHRFANRIIAFGTSTPVVEQAIAKATVAKHAWAERHPQLARIVGRLKPSTDESKPGLLWCVDPWREIAGHREELAGAKRHGLTGIHAIGGIVARQDDDRLVARTLVLAPRPHEQSLQLFAPVPNSKLSLPPWLPRDNAEVAVLSCNLPVAFEQMGPLFDDMFAEGIQGTYQAILEDLKAADGLGLDLRKQLFPHLGSQAIFLRASNRARTGTLYAFQVANSPQVVDAVRALMIDDPEVVRERTRDGAAELWLLPGVEGMPTTGVTVAKGYLMYASDIAILRSVLDADETTQSRLEQQARKIELSSPAANLAPCVFLGKLATGSRVWDQAGVELLEIAAAGPGALWQRPSARHDLGDWLLSTNPLSKSFPAAVGYASEDGWTFHSVAERKKREKRQ